VRCAYITQLANLKLTECKAPKEFDESPGLDDDNIDGDNLDDGLDITDDNRSTPESPMLALSEVAYEPEAVEVPAYKKKKRHPSASLWER